MPVVRYDEDAVRAARGYGWNQAPAERGRRGSNGDREFNQRHRNIRGAGGRRPSAWLVGMLEFFGW